MHSPWPCCDRRLSDALDGYFARLLKQGTPIGRQLDPLVDKVIVSGCYIYLATISGRVFIPGWSLPSWFASS